MSKFFQSYVAAISGIMPFGPLSGITLQSPVNVNGEPSRQLREGDFIRVVDNDIKEHGKPTHVVTSLRGTNVDQFEISVMNIVTQSLHIIKL